MARCSNRRVAISRQNWRFSNEIRYEIGTTNALLLQVSIWRDHTIGPKPRKMAIIIPRRRRGTWEGVFMATWCSEWICRTWGGLGPHILIFPGSLSLPPMRGAVISRAPTILHDDSFYTRISNFVKSPILSTTASSCGSSAYIANGTFCKSHVHSRPGCWDVGGRLLRCGRSSS